MIYKCIFLKAQFSHFSPSIVRHYSKDVIFLFLIISQVCINEFLAFFALFHQFQILFLFLFSIFHSCIILPQKKNATLVREISFDYYSNAWKPPSNTWHDNSI